MEKEKNNLILAAGIFLIILLYTGSLCFRGMPGAEEYEFALLLRKIFPRITGSFLPKLPSALATLSTGALLWLTAKRIGLRHPGCAAGLYLCFPPVWWVGTSVSATPLLVLLVNLAAAGAFFTHREKSWIWKTGNFIIGLSSAAGAVFFIREVPFNLPVIAMAALPIIVLFFSAYIEHCQIQGTDSRKIRKLTVMTAVIQAAMLIFILLPAFCRMLQVDFPAEFTIFAPRERLYRPALALLIPYIWLYISLRSDKLPEKIFALCFAWGFIMMTLPPSLPWEKLSAIPTQESLKTLLPDLFQSQTDDFPVFFADDTTAAAVSYHLNIPVRLIGRGKNDIPPGKLPQMIRETLKKRDVVVVSDDGELDSFLPPELSFIKYTSPQNCKLFRFTGAKK